MDGLLSATFDAFQSAASTLSFNYTYFYYLFQHIHFVLQTAQRSRRVKVMTTRADTSMDYYYYYYSYYHYYYYYYYYCYYYSIISLERHHLADNDHSVFHSVHRLTRRCARSRR